MDVLTIHHMSDISVDRGGEESLIKRTYFAHVLELRFEPRAVGFLLHEHSKLQHLGQKLQDQASSLL